MPLDPTYSTRNWQQITLAIYRLNGRASNKEIQDYLLWNVRYGSLSGYQNEYVFRQTINNELNKSEYFWRDPRGGIYELTEMTRRWVESYYHAEGGKKERERIKVEKLQAETRQREKTEFFESQGQEYEKSEVIEFNGRRFTRDNSKVKLLKGIYLQVCQVCGNSIPTLNCAEFADCGYSEVHHIRPLGSGHDGPDHIGNMLVLCPNHHAAFDLSVMALHPDTLEVYEVYWEEGPRISGKLERHELDHKLDPACLRYAWDELWLKNLSKKGWHI